MINKKDIRVFVCTPATGKTYLAQTNDKFVDLDQEVASIKHDLKGLSQKQVERLKGNHKIKNTFTFDDLKNIINNYLLHTDKKILLSPNPKNVEAITSLNLPYCLVFSELTCIEEYKDRMLARGNNSDFVNAMLDSYQQFYQENMADQKPSYKIILKQRQYLSDVIDEYL